MSPPSNDLPTRLHVEALQRVTVKPRSSATAKAGNNAGMRAEVTSLRSHFGGVGFAKTGDFFQQPHQTLHRQLGVTLAELLVALGISTLLLGAIYTVYLTQTRTQIVQEDIVGMQQEIRAASNLLVRELRMAGYDPRGVNTDGNPNNDFEGIAYDPLHLYIQADLSGNGKLSESNESIQYSHDTKTLTLRRKTGKGGRQPLSDHVKAFHVQYFDQHGQPTITSDHIRTVEFIITAQTAHVDPRYPKNDGHRTFTLRSRVKPRNLAYD